MMNTTVALTDGPSIRKAVTEVLRGSSPAYIVGSANATTKGLWHGPSKDDGNHEAALWSKQPKATSPWIAWWNSMMTKGIDLSDEQIACLLFDVARAENESAAPKPVSLMKALLGGTYQAGDVQLFVAIDWQDADSEVKEAAQQLSKQLHATIGYCRTGRISRRGRISFRSCLMTMVPSGPMACGVRRPSPKPRRIGRPRQSM